MLRRLLRTVVPATVLVMMVSCSSSGSDYDDGPLDPSPQPIQSGPNTVLIPVGASLPSNPAFAPANLIVAVGTTVTWGNNDSIQHTSTSDGQGWNLTLDRGQTASFRFNSAGTFPYHCNIHDNMRGTITVQ